MKQLPKIVYGLALSGLLLCVSLSLGTLLFESHIHLAHLAVHFQLQFFVGALISSLVLLVLKKWVSGGAGILYSVVLYAVLLHPVYLFQGEVEEVDIMFLNSLYFNEQTALIAQEVYQIQPNILTLVESNQQLVNDVDAVFPYRVADLRAHVTSCTAYAVQGYKARIEYFTHEPFRDVPYCIVEQGEYDVITVHPLPPFGPDDLESQELFFDELVRIINTYEEQGKKFIIVGDFNSTLYSKVFRSRFKEYGFGNRYTWNTWKPNTLPLDRVLTNMQVNIAHKNIPGSDHAALLIDIQE